MSKTYKHGNRKLRLKKRKYDDKLPIKLPGNDGMSLKILKNDIDAQAEFCAVK
jgi:hypothetical protein